MLCLCVAWGLLTGCPPDNTPLIEENEELKQQIVKQESMMTTLQEGSRVLQEQIDRLNQELRENENEFAKQLESAQQAGQGLSTDKRRLLQQVAALTKSNQKLKLDNQALKKDARQLRKQLELTQQTTADTQRLRQQVETLTKDNQQLKLDSKKLKDDARWLRKQREIFRQSLQTNDRMVSVQTLPHTLPDVTDAAMRALAQNGYTLMARMKTDQKVVFVTERKTSPSPSIELPGYRNQYLVELEAQPDNQTALKVRAQYEKMAQGGKIIEVGENEVSEIEHRFIQAIQRVFTQPKETGAPNESAVADEAP